MANKLEIHPPFLEDLLASMEPQSRRTTDAVSSSDLLRQLQDVPAEGHQHLLQTFVQQEVKAVLRLASLPAPAVSFFDIGMDSLMAVELRNRLNRMLDKELTVANTVVFDYPNVAALSAHLATEIGKGAVTPKPVEASVPVRHLPRPRERGNTDIAVVGIACRFPGAPDLPAFWRLLEAGETAVADGRRSPGPWDGVLGDPGATRSVHRIGGFVNGLDQFDAEFFDIRPINARAMDPQQRLMLEVSWEALEDAGIDPARLRGSRTGVYFGIASSEYLSLGEDYGEQTRYFGNAMSMAVGRVSYMFGMEGPAMPVELACASSLVSIHHAVVGLQLGETDMALAGGVNAILSKESTSVLADFGILSSSGRCWSFDAAADGYVRGEGCGVVVLKRLVDAEADGDRIWGIISGSATNQNGASGDLVMPSGLAQQRVIKEALARAERDPSHVDYLEAHANGSELGDAIEIRAAAEVYGEGRDPTRPLFLGTVKPNIGHLESAAGVAGLIKVLLSMNHGVIPRHLTFESPNSSIAWDELPVHVTVRETPWPQDEDHSPCAGVSAFSLAGTNAHLIVEGYRRPQVLRAGKDGRRFPAGSKQRVPVSLPEAIPMSTVESAGRRARLLPLSGKSEGALFRLAERYLSWLDRFADELSANETGERLLADMAWTASTGRSHFAHRAGIIFTDTATLREELSSLVASDGSGKSQLAAQVAFSYAGDASRLVSAGEELYECEPLVRAVLDRCDQVFREECGTSLLDVIFARSESPDGSARMLPAVFAQECALTALWLSLGLKPSVFFGTGAGAFSAAYAAGMFTLEEGLRFASRYGVLLEETALEDLETVLNGVRMGPPSRMMLNPVTGRILTPAEALKEVFWRTQLHATADWQQCMESLMALGIDSVIELGSGGSSTEDRSGNGMATPLVLPGMGFASESGRGFVEAAATAYEAGLTLDFTGLYAGEERRRISLPGNPFQRQRYWFDINPN